MTRETPEPHSDKKLLPFFFWHSIFDIKNLTFNIWHSTFDIQKCCSNVLRPLHFRHRIKALLRPRHYKRQSLLFEIWLHKLLLGRKLPKLQNKWYKVSWSVKITRGSSTTKSLSIQRMKEYSFIQFCHVFWKKTNFKGDLVLVPKMRWGLKNMCKEFQEFLKKFGDFWRNFVSLLFQICLWDPKFSNPATRWQCSMPDSCNNLFIASLTTVLFKFVWAKKTVK